MKYTISEQFLAAAIFSGTFTLLMMTGGMMYAIFAEIDGDTEVTVAADNTASPEAFDPATLPAPAAGVPAGNRARTYDCKDMIYQVSHNGIRYVRESGGIYNAAIINDRVRIYRLDYGHLSPVDDGVIDPEGVRKLSYALLNCHETYIRSGAQILAASPGSEKHI